MVSTRGRQRADLLPNRKENAQTAKFIDRGWVKEDDPMFLEGIKLSFGLRLHQPKSGTREGRSKEQEGSRSHNLRRLPAKGKEKK
jgi:hypothetical protein